MKKISEIIIIVGGILVIVGAMIQITGWSIAPYLFLFGAVMFAAVQLADKYSGEDLILKRLRFQQVLGAIFLLISGALMFSTNFHLRLILDDSMNSTLRGFLISITSKNNWIVTLSISAIFELYSAFRIDSRKAQLKK